MSNIGRTGEQQLTKLISPDGHHFTARLLGQGVYELNAVAGDARWGGTAGPGYFELDGTQQVLSFKVPDNHRPTMWEFYHTDGTNPSAANYNLYIEYQTMGDQMWHELYGQAVDTVTRIIGFGETYERLPGHYRVRLEGTAGHRIYVTPRLQMLKLRRFELKTGNPA